MKQVFQRALVLMLALLAAVLPALSYADTYLPDGDVTHADFTLGVALHADGFPQAQAHLADWEAFLQKVDLRGSMDALAMLTPNSRVYLNAALRLNGRDQIPFVYDGYHSYRYLISPALNNEVLFFQMHNFLEFMLKPYYYMELPTQYLALLLYPEATYSLADSYLTPVRDTLAQARQSAQDAAAPAGVAQGSLTYTVPYADLYELCETLDLVVNDDPDLERAYFYFTCLLTGVYASDMTLDMLGRLEDALDALDPEQNGMRVTEAEGGVTCVIGDTEVFHSTADGAANAFAFSLPTPEGFTLSLDWDFAPQTVGAALNASLRLTTDGKETFALTAQGEGMPQAGDRGGEGCLTFTATGDGFETQPAPVALAFSWARDAVAPPYTLGLTVDWLHPATGKPALSLAFHGTFRQADKSVFVEGAYPQNDFFNLNESFLNEYKERMMKPLLLSLVPILLETPAGVINDLYAFAQRNDILVSLVE